LLSYTGFSSLIGVSEKLEPLFLLGSAAMGVIAFVPAYRKKHGRKFCPALFASGLLCLFLRRYIELPSISVEPVVTAVGASLIIGAHTLNLRFSKRCQCCSSLSETIHAATHESGSSASSPQVQFHPDGINPEATANPIPEGKR